MGEFQLIEKYFNRNVSVHNCSNIELGIGDDCALLNVAPDCSLAVSTDTFLEGTHFFKGTSPYAIGYKSLAVNISDLAAMGADPLGFTLALTRTQVLICQLQWHALDGYRHPVWQERQGYRICLGWDIRSICRDFSRCF